MKFVVDAQLPPALVRALRDAGHDASHVADLGLLMAPDKVIWQEARRQNATIITKDDDFAVGGAARFGAPAPSVVWLRLGNSSQKLLLSAFMPMLANVITLLESGELLVEIRGQESR